MFALREGGHSLFVVEVVGSGDENCIYIRPDFTIIGSGKFRIEDLLRLFCFIQVDINGGGYLYLSCKRIEDFAVI